MDNNLLMLNGHIGDMLDEQDPKVVEYARKLHTLSKVMEREYGESKCRLTNVHAWLREEKEVSHGLQKRIDRLEARLDRAMGIIEMLSAGRAPIIIRRRKPDEGNKKG